MKDQLTLFAGDTLANLSPQPGSAKARKMTAISGLRCWIASENTGRLGYLEKMLLGTSAWGSTLCYLTWKEKATPAGHLLFRLLPSAQDTSGSASGLWPTPRSCSAMASSITPERAKDRFPNLEVQVARIMYPTPTAHLHKEAACPAEFTRNTPTLTAEVAMRRGYYPTPSAGDNRDKGNLSSPSIQRRAKKGKQLNLSMVVSTESGALNPEWVEALMGFPVGWTEVGSEE